MGMYTEVFFRAGVDQYAYNAMRYANRHGVVSDEDAHPFFSKPRAASLFDASGSYYFPQANHFESNEDAYGDRSISFRANLKNYDGEIGSFFDWVAPHCEEGFIGYSLYEESEVPTLYFSRRAELVVREPDERRL